MKLGLVAAVVAVAGMATAGSASAAPYEFKASLDCRAPGPFTGTAEIYSLTSTTRTLIDRLECSDTSQHTAATITLDVTDWNGLTEAVEVDFRNSAFVQFQFLGCSFFTPIAGLENQGYGSNFECSRGDQAGHAPGEVDMRLLLFSAGDQPGYIGQPQPS